MMSRSWDYEVLIYSSIHSFIHSSEGFGTVVNQQISSSFWLMDSSRSNSRGCFSIQLLCTVCVCVSYFTSLLSILYLEYVHYYVHRNFMKSNTNDLSFFLSTFLSFCSYQADICKQAGKYKALISPSLYPILLPSGMECMRSNRSLYTGILHLSNHHPLIQP